MDSRRTLLYVSPVFPDVRGNGLAMRAGMFLEALARTYDVYLLVVPIYGSGLRPADGFLDRLCVNVAVVPPIPEPRMPAWTLAERLRRLMSGSGQPRPDLWRYGSPATVRAAAAAFPGVRFDVVHLFRLYMAPFAEPYWSDRSAGRPEVHLDLDDLESLTRKRLAALYRARGRRAEAEVEEAEARKFEKAERDLLPRFDRVYVCSEHDMMEVSRRYRCRELRVVPNAVRVPEQLPPKELSSTFDFLFVGTLGYFPNEDGLDYFCSEIFPRIRRRARMDCRLTIVGAGLSPRILELAREPGVQLTGTVPDVAPYYSRTDAVVVPLRAGGGTRIKVLEAFSYLRPVVSTTVGTEGIEAQDGEHLLVGDSPEAFAEQCVRLMENRGLGEKLAGNAYDLLSQAYSTEAVARILAGFERPPVPSVPRSGVS